ncbi:MAG: type II secretion system F family protein [bacterium]|nr:type II secretion system F family protein [bacterium]MDZ4284261.1 type II secretion system F family protein [Patescibacteria group bacterium]
MLFRYTAYDAAGQECSGEIEAVSADIAVGTLQHRGLVIASLEEAAGGGGLFAAKLTFFDRVTTKDLVILSRQIATLFEARISALRIFQMLASDAEKPILQRILGQIVSDIQGGSSLSMALGKHPRVFSAFYINMVAAGEESGKINDVFMYLADYFDRYYQVTAKIRGAMVYPAFILTAFVGVMVLLLTQVIPQLADVLREAGQGVPIYTRVVIGMSTLLVDYGVFVAAGVIGLGFALWRYRAAEGGRVAFDRLEISVPIFGRLFKLLYLSRIADNLHTMLAAGVPMVRVLEVSSSVVDNVVYETILKDVVEAVRGGASVSESFGRYEEIPGIMVQMIKVGEEAGEVGTILKTLAVFYQREVNSAVDSLISLIEPALVMILGGGVGIVVASVLIPIYNIATSIQ